MLIGDETSRLTHNNQSEMDPNIQEKNYYPVYDKIDDAKTKNMLKLISQRSPVKQHPQTTKNKIKIKKVIKKDSSTPGEPMYHIVDANNMGIFDTIR